MNDGQNIHELETALETQKKELRQDTNEISAKMREMKARLSPTGVLRENVILASVAALLLGLFFGYFLEPPEIVLDDVVKPALKDTAKTAARTAVTTAGKQMVTNAISGG